jgi:alcohol dehydrogenase class IV
MFTFTSITRIVFGRGTFAQLGAIAREFGTRALVVSNADLSGKRGIDARVESALSEKGVAAKRFAQAGEPTVSDIDNGLAAAKSFGCDVVIGFGGGAAIDAAKAIAVLLTHGGGALDYMEVVGLGKKFSKPGVPFIAVPTTAGTGAEVTRNAVVGAPEKQFKASLRGEQLLARVALVDPELQLGVSPEVTARTGMDALTQNIEAYTSNNANAMSDALALQGIERAGRGLLRAYKNGNDLDAREDMALSALLSGIALTNAGLGAVHAFAAPMGAKYPVPHGTVCAALLPPVIRVNIAALRAADANHPALARYAHIAAFLNLGPDADALSAYVETLRRELQIPGLGTFGLKPADFADLISLARKANNMKFNPASLSDAQLEEILNSAM